MIIVVAQCVLNLLPLWIARDNFQGSTLQSSVSVLRLYTDDDSWGPMKEAVDYFYSTPDRAARIYLHTFFENSIKFQYPPSALLISSAMRAMHLDADRSVFAYIGFGFIVLTAVGAFLIVENRYRAEAFSTELSIAARFLRLGCLLVLAFTFRPIVSAFAIGQIQVWLSGMFVLALLFWTLGLQSGVGVIIGLMCCIKPQYAFILIWAIAAGRWSTAISGFATVAVATTIAIAIFGFQNHLDYLEVLSTLSKSGESFVQNQSVNGLLNRILSVNNPRLFNNLDWRGDHFPPFVPWVYTTVAITSALFLAISLASGFMSRGSDQIWSFCAAGLSCTMASPIAWSHHYGILFPVYFLLLVNLRLKLTWAVSTVGLYLVVANWFSIFDKTAGSYWNFLQSPVFFAGLGTLAILYLAPKQLPQESDTTGHQSNSPADHGPVSVKTLASDSFHGATTLFAGAADQSVPPNRRAPSLGLPAG